MASKAVSSAISWAETDEPAGSPVNRALALRIATRLLGATPSLRWRKSDEVDVFVASFGAASGVPDSLPNCTRDDCPIPFIAIGELNGDRTWGFYRPEAGNEQ